MKYILEGNDKELERVIKESRIRINRGLISITPISECGLITEEDARKTIKEQFDIHDVKVQELVSSLEEKDSLISVLEEQCDGFKARIVELETPAIDDNKNLSADDSKELPVGDSKNLNISDVDEKTISPAEVKKPGRPKNSN